MEPWNLKIRVEPQAVKLLATDPSGDRLKACLPLYPHHPRALLTLLESLALWTGQVPLSAATSVDDRATRPSIEALLGDELWPVDSALVRFTFEDHHRPTRRIRGVGDFRLLYGGGGGR